MRADFIEKEDTEVIYRLLMPENGLAIKIADHTGLRISDVLSLKRTALKPSFSIVEAKTGKKFKVNLGKKLFSEIQRFCTENPTKSEFLFPNKRNFEKHRTRQAVWADVKRAGKALRMRDNVSPHSFRKAFAVQLMRKGVPLGEIQRRLNHTNEATTIIYALADALRKKKK